MVSNRDSLVFISILTRILRSNQRHVVGCNGLFEAQRGQLGEWTYLVCNGPLANQLVDTKSAKDLFRVWNASCPYTPLETALLTFPMCANLHQVPHPRSIYSAEQ